MNWFIISETAPSNSYTGRLWIKPSIPQAYMLMGSDWIPVTSGGTPITIADTTILIDGIDKSSLIQKNSLIITDILNQEADTCAFMLVDSDGTNKPSVGQEVQVFRNTILIFGGKITEAPQSKVGIQIYMYEILATDFTQDLTRAMVVNSYTSTSAGGIIRDFMDTNVKSIGTFFVEDGLTIDSISFNWVYPADAIQRLAEMTGYTWYVDYERQLHFFDRLTNTAPFQLTDSLTDGEYNDLVVMIDRTQLKNQQTIRGGFELSSTYPQLKDADGNQTSFDVDYAARGTITVEVDAGGGFVSKTVGIDNIDTSGFDFVINVTEKVIKNLDLATLNAGDVLKLTYKYEKPILARVRDQESIEAVQAIEGGQGIYEAPLIIDDTIDTKEAAAERANAEILQFSNPLVTGTFTTTQNGYRSGQLLTVNIPSRDINTTYLIRSVTSTSLGHGIFNYNIEFATKLKGLTEFLLYLYSQGVGIFERTDENLHDFEQFKNTITVSEIIASTLLTNVSANPVVWSNDAETTPDRGQWNSSQYG